MRSAEMESSSMVDPGHLQFDSVFPAANVDDSDADGVWTTLGKRLSDPLVPPPKAVNSSRSPQSRVQSPGNVTPFLSFTLVFEFVFCLSPLGICTCCTPALQHPASLPSPCRCGLGVRTPGS